MNTLGAGGARNDARTPAEPVPPALDHSWRAAAPSGCCDCHVHIYDHRVPSTPPDSAKPDASVEQYRQLQARIGITRAILVTASNYADNNDAMLSALSQLRGGARGVAAVSPAIEMTRLRELHDRGVRAIRITRRPAIAWNDVLKLSHLAADIGWHLELNLPITEYAAHGAILEQIPTNIVFDHHAGLKSATDPLLPLVLRLLDRGKAWIKLSSPYICDPDGAPSYPRAVGVARLLMEAAPERLVWGSGWPHPNAKVTPVDGLINLNLQWAPSADALRRVLVENPIHLYQFGVSGQQP